jgi:hypothetical protein
VRPAVSRYFVLRIITPILERTCLVSTCRAGARSVDRVSPITSNVLVGGSRTTGRILRFSTDSLAFRFSSALRASSISIVYFPARFTRSVESILSIVRELPAQPGEKIHSDIPEWIPFLIITSGEWFLL